MRRWLRIAALAGFATALGVLTPSVGRVQDGPVTPRERRARSCPRPPTPAQRRLAALSLEGDALCSSSWRTQVVNLCPREVRLRSVDPSRAALGPDGEIAHPSREHRIDAGSCPRVEVSRHVELLDRRGRVVSRAEVSCAAEQIFVARNCRRLIPMTAVPDLGD